MDSNSTKQLKRIPSVMSQPGRKARARRELPALRSAWTQHPGGSTDKPTWRGGYEVTGRGAWPVSRSSKPREDEKLIQVEGDSGDGTAECDM